MKQHLAIILLVAQRAQSFATIPSDRGNNIATGEAATAKAGQPSAPTEALTRDVAAAAEHLKAQFNEALHAV